MHVWHYQLHFLVKMPHNHPVCSLLLVRGGGYIFPYGIKENVLQGAANCGINFHNGAGAVVIYINIIAF